MKNKRLKRALCAVFALCLLAAGLPAYAAGPQTAEVTLSEDEADAAHNYTLLRQALLSADGETPCTVALTPENGTFYIELTGAALRLKSNVTLDLNGGTLVRYGEASDGRNLLQNCGPDGENDAVGGYALTKSIALINGTLDGNTALTAPGSNLVNFGHADGVTLQNVTLRNLNGGHLAELSGCKNCRIENCVFSGSGVSLEALQLDTAVASWNGVFLPDGAPCRDVLVTGCTFLDAPSGVGNHHALAGGENHARNIIIENNTFLNSTVYDELQPAVWCYGFESCEVRNNVIDGCYADGIKMSGGKVCVSENSIRLVDSPYGSGVYVTAANSTLPEETETDTRTKEPAFGCRIENNTILAYGRHGISVNTGSETLRIANNVISGGGGTGIFVSHSTVTEAVADNCIEGSRFLTDANPGHGIHVTSTATVSAITGNTVTGCEGYGVACYQAERAMRFENNACTDNALGETRVTYKPELTEDPKEKPPEEAGWYFAPAPMTAAALLSHANGARLTVGKPETTADADAPAVSGMRLYTETAVYTVIMLGDPSGDGLVTTADARLALRYAIGLDSPAEQQRLSAAIHTPETVTTADARAILRAAIGLERIHIDFN